MKPFRIAVFFSGLERSLANSAYNLRQDECKAAAYSLLAYAGLDYGKFRDTRLREVPEEVFGQYTERLPEAFRKRAEHYFSEMRRAQEGMQDFTMSLKNLVQAKKIDRATAFQVAPNIESLKMALKGTEVKEPGIL